MSVSHLGLKPLPIITSVDVVETDNAGALTYQIESTYSPYWYDAMPLPTGLVIDHQTGLISGTIDPGEDVVMAVSATDYKGQAVKMVRIINQSIPGTYDSVATYDSLLVSYG